MKYKSIWDISLNKEKKQTLKKDIECDVLIIGGGITGLTTAFYLQNSNKKVVLVERNYLGSGSSGKSTAKINYLQDILSKISDNNISSYIDSQIEAINLITKIINDNKIECDLKKCSSYLFGNTNKEIKSIKNIEKVLKNKKIIYRKEKLPIKIENKYAIKVNDTYTFNPGLYINALRDLLNKTNIYENTFVNNIEKHDNYYLSYASNYKIKSKTVVIASWYPFFIKPYFFPLKAHLERSYLGCFKTKNNLNVTAINLERKVKSFRYYKNYLIYLINSHIICNGNTDKNILELSKKFKNKPVYLWSNIDIITNDHLPFVGKIDENLLIGTGYNTWGNTNATLSGKILSDIILDKNNKYIEVFDPKRATSLQKIGNNIINSLWSIKGYIKYLWIKKDNYYYFGNKAIYIDTSGKKHIVKAKCPHMKCKLIFNNEEKTWDCPCHASRFDTNGNCIFGPSNHNIKTK